MRPRTRSLMNLILCSALGIAATPSHAQRSWYVTPNGIGGDAPTIQAAVDSAQAGDAVCLTPGTYTWASQHSTGESMIRITKPLVRFTGDWDPQRVTIDAQGMGRILDCSNVEQIYIFALTFTNGACRSSATDVRGGALLVTGNSSPKIEHCVFTNNFSGSSTGGAGGAVACDSAFIRLCDFFGNQAGGPAGEGGAVACGPALITDCRIYSNSATGILEARGGAIRGHGVTIQDCFFRDCSCIAQQNPQGGAVYGAASVRFCEFGRCSASGVAGRGGAICEAQQITWVIFYDNSASAGSAVAIGEQGAIAKCTIVHNSGGSAVDIAAGTIANCTLVGNEAANPNDVGGIMAGSVSIRSTIVNRTLGLPCGGSPTQSWGCCDIFGNSQGNAMCGIDSGGNFSADPLFCTDPVVTHNDALYAHSPCARGNHPSGAESCDQVGISVACSTPVVNHSWSDVKRLYR